MSTVTDILKLLLPPKHDAGERHVNGWRWAVVVVVLVLLANAAAGRGLIPGIPAYALGSDVKIMLELQYAAVIQSQHEQMCRLQAADRAVLRQTIEEYQRRYRELTGERYPTTPCPQ